MSVMELLINVWTVRSATGKAAGAFDTLPHVYFKRNILISNKSNILHDYKSKTVARNNFSKNLNRRRTAIETGVEFKI